MKTLRIDKWVVLACAVGLVGGLVLSGCPSTGITCPNYLAACGQGCADYSNDKANCGACGLSCQSGQVCTAGACVCQPGSQACGGACVSITTDPQNCGGCAGSSRGAVCSAGQVCDKGHCAATCTLGGSNRCGNSCVDFTTDPFNCGGCGVACPDKQSCHAGKCSFDVVVACFGSHGVTGLQQVPGGAPLVSPVHPFGSGPESLAVDQNVLLSADGLDRILYEGDLTALVPFTEAPPVGNAANHILVDDPYVYVVNSSSNSLEILQRGAFADAGVVIRADAGTLAGGADGGLGLVPVAVVDLGANTYPQAVAKFGPNVYVPLNGTNELAVINVADPRNPGDGGLRINLQNYANPGAQARPSSVLSRNGFIYVTLTNSDLNTYAPVGNGSVVKISPLDRSAMPMDLGGGCSNAYWLTASSDGTLMYVSCSGTVTYTSSYTALSVDKTQVQVYDLQEHLVGAWSPSCPSGVDAGCAQFSAGRIGLRGSTVYVGDNSYGRLVVLDTVDGGLVERAGYQDGGMAPLVCPSTGASLVSDILNLP